VTWKVTLTAIIWYQHMTKYTHTNFVIISDSCWYSSNVNGVCTWA